MKFLLALLFSFLSTIHLSVSLGGSDTFNSRDNEVSTPRHLRSHILIDHPHLPPFVQISCDPVTAFTPLYRTYSIPRTDYFYTINNTLVTVAVSSPEAQYAFQGTAGLILISQSNVTSGTLPLYALQLITGTDYDRVYTTSMEELASLVAEGYSFVWVEGYVYGEQVCGSVPLYRVYNAEDTYRLYTTSEEEYEVSVASGMQDQGVTGYVLPV